MFFLVDQFYIYGKTAGFVEMVAGKSMTNP